MQIHGLGWTSKYSPPPPKKKTSLTTDLRRIQLREHQYHHSRGYAPRISCLSQRERSHPLLCASSADTECNYGCLYFTFSVTGRVVRRADYTRDPNKSVPGTEHATFLAGQQQQQQQQQQEQQQQQQQVPWLGYVTEHLLEVDPGRA